VTTQDLSESLECLYISDVQPTVTNTFNRYTNTHKRLGNHQETSTMLFVSWNLANCCTNNANRSCSARDALSATSTLFGYLHHDNYHTKMQRSVLHTHNYGCTEYSIQIRTGPNSGPNGLFVFGQMLPRFGTRIRIVDNFPRGHAAAWACDETQQLMLASVMKCRLSS